MVMTGVATPESALITRTRGGDMAAYDELYRRHVDEAVKVARIVCDDRDDVPDLVNEAFTRVLGRLTEGGGPDDDLGPYLRTIVRRLAVDRFHGQRRHTSADPESLEVLPTTDDPIGRAADKHLVRTAFETLPERWQRVLWHTEIEGRSPASLASTLGMAPNAVAALAYRAREGLRQAYMTVNLPRKVAQECRRFNEKLPAYTRGTLPDDSVDVIAEHLTHCTDCRERRDDLLLLASDLRGLLIPALLVPATGWSLAAAGVTTAGAAAAGATAGATGGGGVLAWLSPAKWGIAATGGSGGAVAGAATGGLAATVAAIAVFTAPFGGGSSAPDVISDPVAAPSLTVEGPMTTREGATGGLGPAGTDDGSALGDNTSGDAAADEDADDEDTDGDTDDTGDESNEKEKDGDEPRGAETEAPGAGPTPGPDPTDDPAPDPDPTSGPTDPPADPDPEPTDPPTDPEPDPEPTEPDPEPTEPDPEPTDPEPDPDPDDDDERLRIDVDLGLGDLLGIDIGLGGVVGIGIE